MNFFFCRDNQDVIPPTTMAHHEETSLAAESTVAETNDDEIAENYQLAPGDFTCPKAVLAIGATAKTWSNRLNWIQNHPPLGLQIAHDEGKNKYQTPLVQRIHYHQKQIAKKVRNGKRKDPNYLKQMFFIPVFDGELLNQSVGYQSEDRGYLRICDILGVF